jgi:hypothetical protein
MEITVTLNLSGESGAAPRTQVIELPATVCPRCHARLAPVAYLEAHEKWHQARTERYLKFRKRQPASDG